ncbi:hypothetical protein [Kineosporia succinea]|uniref:Uncharacterized protein n=1 Tax=Kineosporia succinea TaxID=84632 RepID=A0ABT9P9I0_9ACTN|nr:hypothetical protein [Kineosporia succinea]MDP9829356.1 hypothetical protein [Kineosporia succinea]
MKKWRLAWSEDDSEVYTDKQGLRDGIKTVRAAWQGGDFKSPWVEVWFTEGYGWEAQERFSLAVPDVTEVLAELRDRAQGAAAKLSAAAAKAESPAEKYRLSGKVEGVKLVESYFHDVERRLAGE